MLKGKVKKMFPGNNTSEGFFSFYNYIIKPGAVKIFILKGGPGVGKSTMMKKIGMVMNEKGYDVEYHCCSSDNDSLDGVVLPALRIAILDGTAPHVVDPKAPGVVEEIVNLGEFWDNKILIRDKENIIDINKRKAKMFELSYRHLKEAKVAHEELESYFEEAIIKSKLNKITYEVTTDVFKEVKPRFDKTAYVRRLFASANTPQGHVNHLDSILQDARTLYTLKGEAGSGKEEFLEVLYQRGTGLGYDCEVYHCPFEPLKMELVYFPDFCVGFLRLNEPLEFDTNALPKLEKCEELDFAKYCNPHTIQSYNKDIVEAKKRISVLRKKAWEKLMIAKMLHKEIEGLYHPSIDFTAITRKREEILKEIFNFC